jgi:hypothetical protein
MWHVWDLVGKLETTEHLENLSIVGLTILEWDVIKGNGSTSVGFI